MVLAAVAPGAGKPCWAGELLWCRFRKADGEDARRSPFCDVCPKEIVSGKRVAILLSQRVISNQPGMEPGKCRESWAFSLLVIHSLFVLALEKEQSSGLFSSSQPRQTSLMETGSLQKKNVEGVGLFSLPFILLEKRRRRIGSETGISFPD